ncbi:MAG: hypothetical protein ABR611_02205 [Chthoniobacterales bacterium]
MALPLDLISTSAFDAPASPIPSRDMVFSQVSGSDYATFVTAMESPDYVQIAEVAPVPETSTWVAAAMGALILFRPLQKRVTALRRCDGRSSAR